MDKKWRNDAQMESRQCEIKVKSKEQQRISLITRILNLRNPL